MAIESSVIPLPSELIIPPAGYLISNGEMSWVMVIFAGAIGSLLGSYLNYAVARHLGRPFLLRYGKYFFLSEEHLNQCDRFFEKHGEIAIFIGRLLPGIRHLISIPAGISKMNLYRFSFYTTLGAGIWVSVLAYIGYIVGTNRELVDKYLSTTTAWVLAFSGALVAIYWIYQQRKKDPESKSNDKKEKRCLA
ncbi:MAG: DedA family protein [Oligoflexia bacterium]|nr:DedA family protein [Oligoflexia bacterium]